MILKYISVIILPAVFMLIIIYGWTKKVDIFSAFLIGAKDGLKTLFGILPALVGLIAAITMFRTSGALQFITGLLSPITKLMGIPAEIMPLALLRPVSGSGSLALVNDILTTAGPDSMVGRIASVIMGSTETTFYTLAVYYGSVNIRHSRHTVPAALLADVTGIIAGTFICLLFYH
ncbi:MAG: spore maturation protein [Ruminococcaceae bacterium]|nr:spore maturation protein [Oscillospiraceae bacterium]